MIAQNNIRHSHTEKLDACRLESKRIQAELEACNFNLKTLNDISKDIYGSVETDTILKNFLLMCMGNFGIFNGFTLLLEVDGQGCDHFAAVGFPDEDVGNLRENCRRCIEPIFPSGQGAESLSLDCAPLAPFGVEEVFPFRVEPAFKGIIGLGSRLMADTYSAKERELLETLINSLVVALKNAKSFESILDLNQNLAEKNIALETALKNLKAEMRKVEILESVKENLGKFVPHAVSSAIERSPTGHMPESRNHDLSVLFLDIEGYTKLTEKLGGREVNTIIEKHFSVFMDAIHVNNGDVNETAGDGLMVLFLEKDQTTNAMDAVHTAVTIQKETARIGKEIFSLYKPLSVNIGINSGTALVGAAKFDSITGSRWTYTARGSLVNVAARIGALATGGQTFLSRTTADHVIDQIHLKNLGKFELKNVKEPTEVFLLD
ncbi:MAG: adenylate/guanylate cyclase domain-containing protein [Thermodesulfobacteriota bacterium]